MKNEPINCKELAILFFEDNSGNLSEVVGASVMYLLGVLDGRIAKGKDYDSIFDQFSGDCVELIAFASHMEKTKADLKNMADEITESMTSEIDDDQTQETGGQFSMGHVSKTIGNA